MTDHKKELEEFAYIVSHDLNAPLRHIKSFGNLLVQKLDDKVSDEEREYLKYMEDSIVKLEAMIENLLEYSRLSTQANNFTEFDCNALVQNIVVNIKKELEEHNAIVKITGLPQNMSGDKKQIGMMFWHLLDNALKFSNNNAKTVIEISAEEQNKQWLFCVTDNGIGMPDAQRDQIFKMFKRLDPANHPGIGAGLTFCKKIVERHGGEIRLETNDKTNVIFSIIK